MSFALFEGQRASHVFEHSNIYSTSLWCAIFTLKLNKMKETKLTFQQVEQLQHILKHYMHEFKDHTSEKHYNELEVLKNKLIVMRAQAEYSEKWKNNSFLELERLESERKKCLELGMYEKAANLRDQIRKKNKEAK